MIWGLGYHGAVKLTGTLKPPGTTAVVIWSPISVESSKRWCRTGIWTGLSGRGAAKNGEPSGKPNVPPVYVEDCGGLMISPKCQQNPSSPFSHTWLCHSSNWNFALSRDFKKTSYRRFASDSGTCPMTFVLCLTILSSPRLLTLSPHQRKRCWLSSIVFEPPSWRFWSATGDVPPPKILF